VAPARLSSRAQALDKIYYAHLVEHFPHNGLLCIDRFDEFEELADAPGSVLDFGRASFRELAA
jgi:hypothetical protein